MSDLSATLQNHLCDSAKKGSPSTVLFAQIAFFTTTIFLWKTRLCAEHDSTGIIVALSYQIISAILISNSWRLSQCKSIHGQCSYKVNLIANGFFFIGAIVLEKFYEKSLSSLGFALGITVLFLILLVIIQPSTDLGLFGFLFGVISSVAVNLFGHKFQTWIVVAICLTLLGVRGWLEEKWLKASVEHQPQEDRSSKSKIIEAVVVASFHLFWVLNLFKINCQKIKGSPKSISCTLSSLMGMQACVLIFSLWFGLALVLRVHSLFNARLERPVMLSVDLGTGDYDSELMRMLACVLIFSLWFGLALVLRVHSLFNARLERLARMSVDLRRISVDLGTVDYDSELSDVVVKRYMDYDSESTEVEEKSLDYDSEPTKVEEKSLDYDSEPIEVGGLSHRRRRREHVEDLPPTRRKVEKEDHHPEEKTAWYLP
ncbi:hypothetical protein SLA2020_249710 [Shorea laevis]